MYLCTVKVLLLNRVEVFVQFLEQMDGNYFIRNKDDRNKKKTAAKKFSYKEKK